MKLNGGAGMNNPTEEHGLSILDRALNECLSLIASAKFSSVQGLHTGGEIVSISVWVRPEPSDPDVSWVQVMCHAAGHLKVDWERVPLWLFDLRTGTEVDIGVLDAQGRSKQFRVSRIDQQSLGFLDPGQIVNVGLIKLDDVALHAGPAIDFIPKTLSRDFDAKARLEDQTLYVTVTALNASVRGARVVFEIRPKARGAGPFYSAEFSLTDKAGWEGVFSVKEELARLPPNEEFEMFVRAATGGVEDRD
jgi:hypothetical protein